MFYLLRLFIRALLPPPPALPVHEIIAEMRALRAVVQGVCVFMACRNL
jgi:hypothetical protein